MILELPLEACFPLGDRHYNAPNVQAAYALRDLFLVATRRGTYPDTDDGVEMRCLLNKLRSVANENFNEHFKAIFSGHDRVSTKGLAATHRYALGAVLVSQWVLWYRHEQGLSLRGDLKAFVKAL